MRAMIRIAVPCGVMQCVEVWCSVVQCVAMCCSVLQCVAVYCGVLQCVAHIKTGKSKVSLAGLLFTSHVTHVQHKSLLHSTYQDRRI